MTPEERARAIAEHIGPLPRPVREELERVVASAIRRAIAEELARLEKLERASASSAEGRGKSRKGFDPVKIQYCEEFAETLLHARHHIMGTVPPDPDPFGDLDRLRRIANGGPR